MRLIVHVHPKRFWQSPHSLQFLSAHLFSAPLRLRPLLLSGSPLNGTSTVGQGNSPAPHHRSTDTYRSWQSRSHGMKSETTGSVASNTQSVCSLLSPVRRPTKSQPFNSNCFVTQHQSTPPKKRKKKGRKKNMQKKSSVIQLLASEKHFLKWSCVRESCAMLHLHKWKFHRGENQIFRLSSEMRPAQQQKCCNASSYSHYQKKSDSL